jgi:hypothetical protein
MSELVVELNPADKLNSGERIPSRLRREGVSEQNTKKVIDGIRRWYLFAIGTFYRRIYSLCAGVYVVLLLQCDAE